MSRFLSDCRVMSMGRLILVALASSLLTGCELAVAVLTAEPGSTLNFGPVRTPTPSSDVCDDPAAFEGSLSATDTIAWRGCAYFKVMPGFRLVVDGEMDGVRHVLTIERGGRPPEGAHGVGAWTEVVGLPPVIATMVADGVTYSSGDGSMTITKSLPDTLEGSIRLKATQSRAGTREVTIAVRFRARCSTTAGSPCT
jgi:hypothetical protein